MVNLIIGRPPPLEGKNMAPTNSPPVIRAFCGVLRHIRRRPVLGVQRRGRPMHRGHRSIGVLNAGPCLPHHGRALPETDTRLAIPVRAGDPRRGGRRPHLHRRFTELGTAGPSNWMYIPPRQAAALRRLHRSRPRHKCRLHRADFPRRRPLHRRPRRWSRASLAPGTSRDCGGLGNRTMAARRGATPFFNAGLCAGGSAPPPPRAIAPARWNATAAANRRPDLIRTCVHILHGEAARRLPNGAHHQEHESSPITEEYLPEHQHL